MSAYIFILFFTSIQRKWGESKEYMQKICEWNNLCFNSFILCNKETSDPEILT